MFPFLEIIKQKDRKAKPSSIKIESLNMIHFIIHF